MSAEPQADERQQAIDERHHLLDEYYHHLCTRLRHATKFEPDVLTKHVLFGQMWPQY